MIRKNLQKIARMSHASSVNFIALAILAASVIAVTAMPHAPVNDTAGAEQGGQAASRKEGNEAKILHLTLRTQGFEPAAVTRRAGLYLLVIDDRSGVDDTELSLEREGGERLRARRGRGHRQDWREALQLTPGTYLVKDSKRPNWVCRITITPR